MMWKRSRGKEGTRVQRGARWSKAAYILDYLKLQLGSSYTLERDKMKILALRQGSFSICGQPNQAPLMKTLCIHITGKCGTPTAPYGREHLLLV